MSVRTFSTVIPEWTSFNFTHEYEPTPLSSSPLRSSRSRMFDQMPNDLSSVEPYDEGVSLRNSFFSIGAEIS